MIVLGLFTIKYRSDWKFNGGQYYLSFHEPNILIHEQKKTLVVHSKSMTFIYT